ncbi:hypothetical protein VNO77_02991 [Canavalia gladiata]|uniref:Uncharacterized protein n=1 Tax=Canavalia gladiata TaxID=3824 RepID=A0AAN9MTZ3_CANGL
MIPRVSCETKPLWNVMCYKSVSLVQGCEHSLHIHRFADSEFIGIEPIVVQSDSESCPLLIVVLKMIAMKCCNSDHD